MEKYNYYKAVKKDLLDVMVADWDFDLKRDLLNDFINKNYNDIEDYMIENYVYGSYSDSITGALNHKYPLPKEEVEEALCHNWDLIQFAYDGGVLESKFMSPFIVDMNVRIRVAESVVGEVIKEFEEDFFERFGYPMEEEEYD